MQYYIMLYIHVTLGCTGICVHYNVLLIESTMSLLIHKYCPHCQEMVAPETYRCHWQLYFNESSKTWKLAESTVDFT